jgi:pimeloyl-ACP methyl ester carboxylesterase
LSTPLEVPTLSSVAEIVGRVTDDAGIERFVVIGFSGGGPFALACGALLTDRVSRVAAVSSWGLVDELEAAYASLTADEPDLLNAIRTDPAEATERLWEHAQWYAETPLRSSRPTPRPATRS